MRAGPEIQRTEPPSSGETPPHANPPAQEKSPLTGSDSEPLTLQRRADGPRAARSPETNEDKTVSFPPQETVPAAPHETETAGQGPKAGDISPAVEKNTDIPLARRSMDRPGSRIDRKAADETRTDGELTGAAETGAAGEPLSAVPPPLPPQTLQSTAPEPETDQPEPRVSVPIQPVPAVDLGQSLVAKAAARANLPMTARSAVLQRRTAAQGSAPFQPGPGDVPQAMQHKGTSLFSPVESLAVLPQARFERQDEEGPAADQTDQSVGSEARSASSIYVQAFRPAAKVQRMPLQRRAAPPDQSESLDTGTEMPSSREETGTAQPPAHQIQRMLANGVLNLPAVLSSGGVAQRTESDVVDDTQAEQDVQDLDQLARRVYPIIKRMLAIERERVKGR